MSKKTNLDLELFTLSSKVVISEFLRKMFIILPYTERRRLMRDEYFHQLGHFNLATKYFNNMVFLVNIITCLVKNNPVS